ncbi:hypothetical protein [Aromatoleum petrolei]|uniref:DUF4168 domain-containing protein n=1 Tax=Aromatoleum petrolei TaxID=76116 RepID=A0ABX1MZJ3_9RHOO|nr:hypothetical protein [Aromatoleum petrolei]NMF90477.1 hypothetical protein [Aromatoleum petrolei]QTQ35213.1 Uncharacterized protein ToN1_10420 [Aromatoleum petrolei]
MRSKPGSSWLACVAAGILLALPLAPSAMAQSGPSSAMDPARTASLSAASRRIEDHFVAEVARITGTTPARVRRAMPDERRITSTASRLISALEVDLGAPLTPEQQAEILDADQARKVSLMKAREAARGR